MNPRSGPRTTHSMSQQKAWEAGHAAALPIGRSLAMIGCLGSVGGIALILMCQIVWANVIAGGAFLIETIGAIPFIKADNSAAREAVPAGQERRVHVGGSSAK